MRRLRMPAVLVVVLALVALLLGACSNDGDGAQAAGPQASPDQSGLPLVTFTRADAGTEVMRVEVADRDELRFCGLMHRLSMPEDQGMLFTFDADVSGPFWNRNTFIPLTLAWIAEGGEIVDITDLPNVRPEDNPQENVFVGPRASYRYVIEANQGWFDRHGVRIGDRVAISEAVQRGSEGAVSICREKGL
ncbi:MAG: DUF192 domain-containing protein [Chloroflexi bacterium]|nr:DUF192 domain-containing protein [Chloroflexota bacterium]